MIQTAWIIVLDDSCVSYMYIQTKERLLESERKLSEMNTQAEVRLTKQVLGKNYKLLPNVCSLMLDM